MRFSFIVPVHNVENYLDECVKSIVTQSFSDFELLLIDDGSTDASGEKCDAWAERDSRVRVLHQKNKGVSAARNIGISMAEGEYFVFLDSDDFWISDDLLDKIEIRLENTNADVLNLNYCKWKEGRLEAPYFHASEIRELQDGTDSLENLISRDLWIACAWNKISKRELFADGDLLFVTGITSEDIDWCARLAVKANKFDYVSFPVIAYRQREASISKTITALKVEDLIKNIEQSQKILELNETKNGSLQSYLAYQVGTLLFNISLLDSSNDREEMIKKGEKLFPLLRRSNNQKVKLLYGAYKTIGIHGTIQLLRARNVVRERAR